MLCVIRINGENLQKDCAIWGKYVELAASQKVVLLNTRQCTYEQNA